MARSPRPAVAEPEGAQPVHSRGSQGGVDSRKSRPQSIAAAVAALAKALRDGIGAERYELWFQDHTTLTIDDDGLHIGVPNRFFREWLETQFKAEIAVACRTVLGATTAVHFRIDAELFQKSYCRTPIQIEPTPPVEPPAVQPKPQRKANRPNEESAPVSQDEPQKKSGEGLRLTSGRYGLAHFVVGTSNRVGFAAAAALVERPASAVSPLFLYGGMGVGKTHLVRGVEEALRRRGDLKIGCYGCEEFTNEFIEAYRSSKLPAFRRKVRALDLLLIDDVQFLAGKKGTQEEIVHALEAVHLRGGKIVLSANVHPRRLAKIGEDLKSRFLAGMTTKLEPPNREMRRQLVAAKAGKQGLELSDEVITYVADQVASGVRELEGAVNFLAHFSETLGLPLDLAAARSALAEVLRHSAPPLDVGGVVAKACTLFHLTKAALLDKSRAQSVAQPRMFVLYLVRKHTGAAYTEIGRRFGGLNHSTVMAAERKIVARLAKDESLLLGDRLWKLRDALDAFEREVGGGS